MISPNIQSAKLIEDYKLYLSFVNGEEKIFDMKPYLLLPVFRPLNNIEEFKKFEIVDGTIEWSCGADLSIDTFYIESTSQNVSSNIAK